MLKAAEMWAQVRQQGKQTVNNQALYRNVILAAQALLFNTNEPSLSHSGSNRWLHGKLEMR
jgi:hypothetical protein